jgi:hypothetical protein
MAEIRVEKKSPMWPWILVALLVIGAIVYFVFINDDNGDRDRDRDRNQETGEPVTSVETEREPLENFLVLEELSIRESSKLKS